MGEGMKISFPWPPKELSPNARVHWAKKARATKAYKNECLLWCLVNKLRPIQADSLSLLITFNPPDNRRRDLDNMLSSFKAGIDAISMRTGINDSDFQITIAKQPVTPKGTVMVEIEAIKPVKVAA